MRARPGCAVLASALFAISCHRGPAASGRSSGDGVAPPPVEIISCVDLPRDDPRSHNLSGLAWDPAERRLYALSDRDKLITVLEPRDGFQGFDLRSSIELAIDVDPWDGEALAIAGDRFVLVANETLSAIVSVDRSGRGATRIDLPLAREPRGNLGLEGLGFAASARGRYLFVVNEQAFDSDGPISTTARGTVVRIVRHALDRGTDLEVAYQTEPVFAEGAPSDNGVSDLAALSPERVLVIERAFVKGTGNAVRIYEVDLGAAIDIAGVADARDGAPVPKRLVVDLTMLPDERCSATPGPQRRRTLDNYEGMALGPTLDDGRRLVFLVSDDNRRALQIPRVLTLALAPGVL